MSVAGMVIRKLEDDIIVLRHSLQRATAQRDGHLEELTALRRELAEMDKENDHLLERASAAEQRNATLTTLLREGLEEYKNGDDWIDRVIEALRDQPTESGEN